MVANRSVADFSIPVSDIEKSTRFYTEVLGCRHRPQTALCTGDACSKRWQLRLCR